MLVRADGPHVGFVLRMSFQGGNSGRLIVGARSFWSDAMGLVVLEGSEQDLDRFARAR
jgi:hypothetical protein